MNVRRVWVLAMLSAGACDDDRGNEQGFPGVTAGVVNGEGSDKGESSSGGLPGEEGGAGGDEGEGTTSSGMATVGGDTMLDPSTTSAGTTGTTVGTTGMTTGTTTGMEATTSTTTGFDTLVLTTMPPMPEMDPTNTTSDTNDTGAATITIDPENLIDDLEDGDGVIYERNGRIGLWYTYNDASASGTQSPAADGQYFPTPGGPNESAYSAHTQGSGFTVWGAGTGFDINNSGSAIKQPYDASAFTGVVFQAKGTGTIRFKIQSAAVVPLAEGGTCNAGDACNDAFGVAVELGPTWEQVVVPFAMVQQEGWGMAATWDPATVMGFQWQAPAGQPFELALDDVAFY